ncbi:Holliday junction resolvase, partial [archaeon]|nr:Holliday junction resolvase [archaeon]
EQIRIFSEKFGAEAWFGIRFDQLGWFFLELKDLKKGNKGYSVSLELAKEKGLNFEELTNSKEEKL